MAKKSVLIKKQIHYIGILENLTVIYSFGMLQPGRTISTTESPLGFNGQRMDNEVHNSSGTIYDFGARIYDSRLGRFLSRDPKADEFPWMSPYVFAANNPIKNIDVYGAGPEPKGFAILVGFPDATAKVNQTNKLLTSIFGKKELKVHHGGVIIVDENGKTTYFDFGRFNERNYKGFKRKKGKAVVRSSKTVPSLSLPNVKIVDGKITEASLIKTLEALGSSKALTSHGYNRMVASVQENIDAGASIEFARNLEEKGNLNFGGYIFGGENSNYCARFARECTQAGGGKISPVALTGGGNVRSTSNNSDAKIYEIENGKASVATKESTKNKENQKKKSNETVKSEN